METTSSISLLCEKRQQSSLFGSIGCGLGAEHRSCNTSIVAPCPFGPSIFCGGWGYCIIFGDAFLVLEIICYFEMSSCFLRSCVIWGDVCVILGDADLSWGCCAISYILSWFLGCCVILGDADLGILYYFGRFLVFGVLCFFGGCCLVFGDLVLF